VSKPIDLDRRRDLARGGTPRTPRSRSAGTPTPGTPVSRPVAQYSACFRPSHGAAPGFPREFSAVGTNSGVGHESVSSARRTGWGVVSRGPAAGARVPVVGVVAPGGGGPVAARFPPPAGRRLPSARYAGGVTGLLILGHQVGSGRTYIRSGNATRACPRVIRCCAGTCRADPNRRVIGRAFRLGFRHGSMRYESRDGR
jgi:hypothetical protein